jgi:hypothetical protein
MVNRASTAPPPRWPQDGLNWWRKIAVAVGTWHLSRLFSGRPVNDD